MATLSDEAVGRIVATARLPVVPGQEAALRTELDELAGLYLGNFRLSPPPVRLTPNLAAKRLRQLAKTAECLYAEASGDLAEWLAEFKIELYGDALRGLLRLAALANRGAALADARKAKTPARRSLRRENPFTEARIYGVGRDGIILKLIRIYQEGFGRPFGASGQEEPKRPREDPGGRTVGPGIRFIQQFFAEVRELDSRAELPSPGAIRQVWRSFSVRAMGRNPRRSRR